MSSNIHTPDGRKARPSAARLATGEPHLRYLRFAYALGRCLALVLLALGLPLIALLVLLVRFTSPGPGIFRQTRAGRGGRIFVMYKIRTMINNAEARTGPTWTKLNDIRITPLGYWLRKLHLDELPQLLNVVRGEMALIGPRPERPEIIETLADEIPGYLDRLEILPGITGLAQINLPPDTDLTSVRRKLYLDLEYARRAGPWLDLRIILCTMLRLVGIPGETAMNVMRLKRDVPLFSKSKPEVKPEHRPAVVGAQHNGHFHLGENAVLAPQAAVRNGELPDADATSEDDI